MDDLDGAMFAAADASDAIRVLERTTDGIYAVDTDWTVTVWNEQMAIRTGIEPSEIVGETLWDVDGDIVPEGHKRQFRRVMESGGSASFEQYVEEPFDYWEEVRVFGDDAGLSVYVREISERKAHQRMLESQRDTLNVLNQVLRHDVRNDLQLILGYADILAHRVGEAEQPPLDTIRKSARHAVELTTTAREITEALFGELEPTERIGLKAVLEDEVEHIRNTHTEAIIHVEWPLADTLVLGDEMLDSVFRNILNNAVRHSDKKVPEITVSTEESDEVVDIRIADNGPGIPDDRKERVFGSGEKGLDSKGTGIGLYLVRMLVESYGGEVWIEDNDPEGAVFVVQLTKVRTGPTNT